MPGVPSSLGCEACRKQKKKCDQRQPKCSRCVRLSIECKGSGQRRWKFLSSNSARQSQGRRLDLVQRHRPQAALTSNHTVLGSRLVHALGTSEIKYNVIVFGRFWTALPQRLGTNGALDASVLAFLCSHRNVCQGYRSSESLIAFGNALEKVRLALSDRRQTYTPSILCAVFLLSLTQAFMFKPGDPWYDHTEVMTHLLPGMIRQGWPVGSFGHNMLIHSISVVIFSCTYRHHLPIDDSVGVLLRQYTPPTPWTSNQGVIPTLAMHNLLRVPYFVREPSNHLAEISEAYTQLQVDLSRVRERIGYLKSRPDLQKTTPTELHTDPTMYLCHYQLMYSLILSIAMLLNCILQANEGWNEDHSTLCDEAATMRESTLCLADDLLCLRPFFSIGVTNTLRIAWGTETDAKKRDEMANMLRQYLHHPQVDKSFLDGGFWVKNYRLRLMRESRQSVARSATEHLIDEDYDPEAESLTASKRCVIL